MRPRMSAEITLRVTAVPTKDQTQEEADAQLEEIFAEYPPEVIADTLATDIWANTEVGWLRLNVEIIGNTNDE